MHTFFEITWVLWWLFAAVITGRWSWRFAKDRTAFYESPVPWRTVYREALLEDDTTKTSIRIQKAERAILLESATQLFTSDWRERTALQDAMNDLRRLRQTYSDNSASDPFASSRR
jgi:hypothetical protein